MSCVFDDQVRTIGESPSNALSLIRRRVPVERTAQEQSSYLAYQRRAQPHCTETVDVSDEEVLVFLSAIEHYDRNLLPDGAFWTKLEGVFEAAEAVKPGTNRFAPLKKLCDRIRETNGVDRFRDRYRQLSASFRM